MKDAHASWRLFDNHMSKDEMSVPNQFQMFLIWMNDM